MRDTHNHPGNVQVFVGAFGKHPGWNDHIDDIGLETDRLVAFKRLLYVEGIGGNIDAGAWERLNPEQKLDGFGSVFLSLADGVPILGRMWASEDGKGRGRYPMVVCVQMAGRPLEWLIEEGLPRLEKVEAACRAAKTADDVREAVSSLRTDLAATIPSTAAPRPPPLPDAPDRTLAELVGKLESMQNGGGFQRVLYKVERDMTAFLAASSGAGRDAAPPQHIRTPSIADHPGVDVRSWAVAMLCLLNPAVPLFLNRPLREAWVDILVGMPRAQQFYCLLASRQAIPFATDVPYHMDPSFVDRANRTAGLWRNGDLDMRGTVARADGTDAGQNRPGWFHRVAAMLGNR